MCALINTINILKSYSKEDNEMPDFAHFQNLNVKRCALLTIADFADSGVGLYRYFPSMFP